MVEGENNIPRRPESGVDHEETHVGSAILGHGHGVGVTARGVDEVACALSLVPLVLSADGLDIYSSQIKRIKIEV